MWTFISYRMISPHPEQSGDKNRHNKIRRPPIKSSVETPHHTQKLSSPPLPLPSKSSVETPHRTQKLSSPSLPLPSPGTITSCSAIGAAESFKHPLSRHHTKYSSSFFLGYRDMNLVQAKIASETHKNAGNKQRPYPPPSRRG